MEERVVGSSSIIIRMLPIRRLAIAAAGQRGSGGPELAAGIARVKSAKSIGVSAENWAFAQTGPSAPKRAGPHRD